MTYYDDVIKHVEKTLGARTSKRFANTGAWHFCKKGKFTPFLKVCFDFQDSYGTFAYYVGPHVASDSTTGCGCRPIGCQRQESWNLHELDEALANLAAYVKEVKKTGTLSVHGGIFLSWNEATRKSHAY